MNSEIINDFSVMVGFINIHLPDYTMSTFMIAQSLAEELGVETNYDAIRKIRETLRNFDRELYKKIKTDYESGCVFIETSSKRVEEILKIAEIINELAIEKYKVNIDQDYLHCVKNELLAWKRPKPQKWKIGDVFSIPLSDGTFGFGQVVWIPHKSSPNCALFEIREATIPSIEVIVSSPIISVANVGSLELNSFNWNVIGNTAVSIDKSAVPKKHRGEDEVGDVSYSAQALSDLAEAYFGLVPWNASLDNDELLLPNVKRPEMAYILSDDELNS